MREYWLTFDGKNSSAEDKSENKKVGLTGGIPHRLRIFQKRKEKIPHEIKDVKKSGSNQRPWDL